MARCHWRGEDGREIIRFRRPGRQWWREDRHQDHDDRQCAADYRWRTASEPPCPHEPRPPLRQRRVSERGEAGTHAPKRDTRIRGLSSEYSTSTRKLIAMYPPALNRATPWISG